MIPFLFIALALGVGLATYEFSPKAHAWADEHARALREALAAHRVADARLAAARSAPDPVTAVHHARAAKTANQVAAQKTGQAAQTAKTPEQRTAVAQSAVTVDAREDEITGTLTDVHLAAAEVEVDPIVAVEHVHEATTTNQAAAQKAVETAEAARTEQQRATAAKNAAKVADRESKIAAALAKFGAGQCDVRSYARVTPQVRDVLLAKLHGKGMVVTGDNPWDIDTRTSGVKLRAVWSPATQMLKLIVTAGAGGILRGEPATLVCPAVWSKIDPILKEIIGS